ncbi:MAG: YceD family protein [Boseongicola sp.]
MASERLRLAELTSKTKFELLPNAQARRLLSEQFGISEIKKLRFSGSLSPDGKNDWRLDGILGATVVQQCVVTLAPVTTRIDETVVRSYLAEVPAPAESDEIEMPEDDTVEPIPETVDLTQIMEEALALALPPWPRAEGVEPVEMNVAAPGIAPLSSETSNPFSSLKSFRDRLSDSGSGDK